MNGTENAGGLGLPDRSGAEAPVAVVTGANRGIGRAVAAGLVEQGWRVAVVVRDRARGETAVAELNAAAGRPAATRPAGPGTGGAGAHLVIGDLSSIATTRQAAEAVLGACPRIDALVHNAALWPDHRALNDDGLEQSFVTNHLAPFLLNHLLEERLVRSQARVVQVSAGLYVTGKADPEQTSVGAHFHSLRTYADTKLCNLMLVPRFARRWQEAGVTINAVHPGVIRTGLGVPEGPLGVLLKAAKVLWKSPKTGAKPVLRLVTDPALAGVTGRYFQLEKEKPLKGTATDAELADRLWEQALHLTGAEERPHPAGSEPHVP